MRDGGQVLRALRDVGLAGWFGGALMGAASVNGAARAAGQTAESVRFANEAWRRWSPLNLAAIGACLVGEAGLAAIRLRRRSELAGVAAEAALTAGALGVSGWARRLGNELEQGAWDAPGAGERATRVRLARVQWAVPVLTGLALVVSSRREPESHPAARRGVRGRVRDGVRWTAGRAAQLRPA